MDSLQYLSRGEEGEALSFVSDEEEADNDSDSRRTERSQSYHGSGLVSSQFPQHDIGEEELLRYSEQRLLRRRRLLVRPIVVLVLGFIVFRTNNSGSFFQRSGNTTTNLRQDKSTIVSANGNSNNYNVLAGASLLDRNPTASAYNVAVDLNDDGANQDVSIGTGVSVENQEQRKDGNGAENTGDTSASSRRNKKKRRDKNDTSYGWIPEVYPDPTIDPVRCGIAYLLSENPSTGTTAEEERRGGLVLGANANTTSDDDSSRLRLCDPDWVLGGVYLEDIAQKMKEFSNRFTPRDLVPILPENELEAQKPEDRKGLTLAVATVRKVGFA